MSTKFSSSLLRRWHTVLYMTVMFLVFACGSNGSGDGNGNNNAGPPVILDTPAKRIAAAMVDGNSNLLSPDDASTLMQMAITRLQQTLTTTQTFVSNFYSNGEIEYSTKFNQINLIAMIQPAKENLEQVFPLVVGDKGNTMASVSTVAGDRIAGYGYDILAGFVPNASTHNLPLNQVSHAPVFKRVLAWLVSSNANMDLSTQSANQLHIAWGSMPTARANSYIDANAAIKIRQPNAAAGLTALNIPFTSLNCDPLTDPIATCAGQAQLVVIGAVDCALDRTLIPAQTARIKMLVNAKIPILYLNAHPNTNAGNCGNNWNDYAWSIPDDELPRLSSLGFARNSDDGNYWTNDAVASDNNLDVTSKKFIAVNKILAVPLLPLMNRINTHNFDPYGFDSCDEDECWDVIKAGKKSVELSQSAERFMAEIDAPANSLKLILKQFNNQGVNIFDNAQNAQTIPLLVLWADLYRKNSIRYPITKTGGHKADYQTSKNGHNYADFQTAYFADALLAYVRSASTAQTDLGNFLGSGAHAVSPSSDFEDVDVTLPIRPSDEFDTAIGRFALPGKPVTIRFKNAPHQGKFSVYLNVASAGQTKLWADPFIDDHTPNPNLGYRRPRNPQSDTVPISTQAITIVSPYGGALQLRFNGATDTTLTVQVKGVAKHPFYDTTQGTPDAAAFFSAVKSSPLGWLEIKTPGIEIHSQIKMANDFLHPNAGNTSAAPNPDKPYYDSQRAMVDMGKYLDETKTYVMEDAYRLAGFPARGLELNDYVSKYCIDHAWNCTDTTLHRPPGVQHYLQDVAANCGWMCSGHPITSAEAFNPRGWGESHELGHNLQSFWIYGGDISGESSNNIFPLHKIWRLRRDLGRDGLGYGGAVGDAQTVFDRLKGVWNDTQYATDKAKRDRVKDLLWTKSTYAAQSRERLYLYIQWVLIYYEVLKYKNPSWTNAKAWDHAWDIYTLLYLHERQAKALTSSTWEANKAKLGFSSSDVYSNTRFSDISSYHDYLLTALSFITGRNQTPIFNLWGIQTSDQVQTNMASKYQAAPPQAQKFYAVICGDDFRSYQSIAIIGAPNAALPWPNGFANNTNNLRACDAATAALP